LFQFNRNIKTLCFGIEAKQPKLTVPKQTKKKTKKQKKWKKTEKMGKIKNSKICSLSNCFNWSSVCFGSIETSKLSVLVLKRNNQNKRFVSDSAETSFGSSFGCFKSKLVSKDTLLMTVGCVHLLYNSSWNSISSQLGSSCQGNQHGAEKTAVRPIHHVRNHTCQVTVLHPARRAAVLD
jgi:hypothetical protein